MEGVGEDEELSHDGDEGDLRGFSGFDEGLVFGFDLRIEPDGAEGGHIERPPGAAPAAANGSFAKGLAAVVCNRREADEACRLLMVDTPELGRIDHEHIGGSLGLSLECWSGCRSAR